MRKLNSVFSIFKNEHDVIGYKTSAEEKDELTNLKIALMMRRFMIFSICLFLVLLIGGSLAFFLSMRDIIRETKAKDLAQIIEIERNKLEASVNNEISLVLTLSNSPLIQNYFKISTDESLIISANEELVAYKNSFSSKSIFWVNDIDRMFYYNDQEPYFMDADDPVNYWYNMTLYETESYNFNINYNPNINETNLWINVPVFNDKHEPIGMVGSSIDITTFISVIYENQYTGSDDVQLYFLMKQVKLQELLMLIL